MVASTQAQTPDAQSTSGVSVSIELSPGHHVPQKQALTGTVTLDGLDHDSYSSVVLRADVAGHEDRTSSCRGDDTGKDIEVDVDESRESREVQVFKRCDHIAGGFGTYDYVLDLSVSRAGIELASAQVHFLVTYYLEVGDTWLPAPEPEAVAWMDPDPRTVDMVVHGEWTQFRFRSNVLLYTEDHLNVHASGETVGHFASTYTYLPPEQACEKEAESNVNWRRAIHQDLWLVACRPGNAVILLRHETESVAPLYTYEIQTLASPATNNAPQFPEAETVRRVAENAPVATAVGLPVAAADADDDTLTYTLEGADAGAFSIVASSGQLLTTAALDFEDRRSYSVTVIASDSSADTDAVVVTIRVTNIDEVGALPLSSAQPQVGAALTATLTDPDEGISDITWVWERSDGGNWAAIDGAVSGAVPSSSAYTPKATDGGRLLRVTASYTDGQGAGKSAQVVTDHPVPNPGPGPINPNPGGGGGGGAAPEESPPTDASEVFKDVGDGAYYDPAVSWMIEHGITKGCAADMFCPRDDVSRAQFMTFLWRAAGEPAAEQPGSEVFSDVDEGAYFEAAVGWAFEAGVTVGCTPASEQSKPGSCPSGALSRAQAATMLHRMVGSPDPTEAHPFEDVAPDAYYAIPISWMAQHQITTGYTPTQFRPDGIVSRAHAAAFIHRTATRPGAWATTDNPFRADRP